MEIILFLSLSVILSAVRNITSKKTAVDTKDNSQFYFSQAVVFLFCLLLTAIVDMKAVFSVSALTVIYGLIYGALLVSSQWAYTLSLKHGNTSVCTVIYSLGFVLPTISGAVFWNEDFTLLNLIGLILALVIILLTAKKDTNQKTDSKAFIFPALLAMFTSGGLGIMQKVQQSSAVSEQTNAFLIISFLFAFVCSIIAFMPCKKKSKINRKIVIYPAITGLSFGAINWLNTILAGRMNSAVFFPVKNIGTILLSTLLGIILFKEKLNLKTVLVIFLSVIAVLIFSL